MQEHQESLSALTASMMRALHSRQDPDPLIDDLYGPALVSQDELVQMGGRLVRYLKKRGITVPGEAAGPTTLATLLRAHPGYGNVILRSRYAEDRLEEARERGVAQYVILGAGLDSYALRHPELVARLKVFEVDHPATQARKRERLDAAGLAPPPNLTFLPLDFEQESVGEALRAAPSFDATAPAFFSWLGVSPYLTWEAHVRTLSSIAGGTSADCELVFNYLERRGDFPPTKPPDPQKPDPQKPDPQAPEAIISYFAPSEISALLADCGFEPVEDLGPMEIVARYAGELRGGLRPANNFRIAHVRKAPR